MGSKWLFWLSALFIMALSAAPRWVLHDRTPQRDVAWTVSDPDSLYHARRVERALLETGLPAATDPFLNHPEGAAIPWPPYYDQLAAWALGPFVKNDDGIDRAALERGVASLPFLFGILTSLALFLAGRQLAGNMTGLAAGGLHALAMGSIIYSRMGNGDHHAFYAFLASLILCGLSLALREKHLRSPSGSLRAGMAIGALMGIAMGSWVAALMLMVVVDGVFAVLLFLHGREARAGLARLGLSLHLAALLTLLPAVLQSPWIAEFPWMVVNLSWFHLTYLGLGALVFVPLFWLEEHARARRFYPWCVGLVLGALAFVSMLLDAGPIAGLREGFDWVSRQNSFMAGIDESRPLFGTGAVPDGIRTYLGLFAWGLPAAWFAGLWHLRKKDQWALLPWLMALPPMALQAAGQVRFCDTLLVPAVVLVAWFCTRCLPWERFQKLQVLSLPALLALLALSQGTTLSAMIERQGGGRVDSRHKKASRELCSWIAQERPDSQQAVLAPWGHGHEIEWAAKRPSVATNFGSYVGLEGFLSPGRFFLSADPVAAEAVLESRGADLVLLGSALSNGLPGWLQAGPAEWQDRFFRLDNKGRGQLLGTWFNSIGGQLLNGGFPRAMPDQARQDSLDFLRMVHVSPTVLPQTPISTWKGPAPYGWIWERVPGARVTFQGAPRTSLAVDIRLTYPSRPGKPDHKQRFLLRGQLDDTGRVTLRVPYNTLANNGDGQVQSARWIAGELEGPLEISESDVRDGSALRIEISATAGPP